MPDKIFGYPDGRTLQFDGDDCVTLTLPDGTSITVFRSGLTVITRHGKRPRVLRLHPESGGQIRIGHGHNWTVIFRSDGVEIDESWDTFDQNGPHHHQVEDRFDRQGNRRTKPDGGNDFGPPQAPTSRTDPPADPAFDEAEPTHKKKSSHRRGKPGREIRKRRTA